MKYGNFSKDGREFVITNPNTPRPWFNYLFNDIYHCLISQTGGGFSYLRDPKYYRLHRWDHLSNDRSGRYLYIKDGSSKGKPKVWTPNWQPSREKLDSWECRHSFGYTAITASNNGVRGSITYFVAKQSPVEMWLVSLTNTTRSKKSLKVYPFIELIAGDVALETHYRNILCLYNDSWFDKDHQTLIAFKQPFKTWHKPGYAFFATSLKVDSYESRKETFAGRYGDLIAPDGVLAKKLANKAARGEDMVAVFQNTVNLKPGETKKFVVVSGITENKNDVIPLVKRFKSVEIAEKELAEIKSYWKRHLEQVWIETPDPKLNLMINLWGKYQLYAITHWRGTSHYHGAEGGQGYRDTCQDVEGLLSSDLEAARAKLERLIYYQYASGHAVSGFSEVEGTWENTGTAGVIKKADVAVWLPYSVVAYVKETGDTAFLKKVIPFHDKDEATVYDHILRAVRYIYSARGEHGLPLIGHADWNDAYDHVGIKGRGESVWLGMALVRAAKHVKELAEFIGDAAVVHEMQEKADELTKIINEVGWDGDWYLAAFNDDGRRIGSKENKEGKVPLNSQTWAILSGVVPQERLASILDKIDNYLDTPYGPALFLPSYTEYNPGIGRVTSFCPGTKENAAVFSHACAFKVVADCTIKRAEKAYDTFSKLLPISKAKEDQEKYKVEPYVWAEYIIGPGTPDRFGEGSFTWNTGTTPWMYVAATEWILGARRDFNGLLVDPCIPKSWKEAKIRRPFRGAVYEITIKNPDGFSHGVKSLTVDGKVLKGNLVPPHEDGRVHRVEVILGKVGSNPKHPSKGGTGKTAVSSLA